MKTIKILPLAICLAALSACTTVKTIEKEGNERPQFDVVAESVSSSGFAANANVRRFVDYEVEKGDFSRVELGNFFDNAVYKANIINIMYKPSTSRPWYEFKVGNSGAAKFNGSRKFYSENQAVIERVADEYGVPAELIVAIIGIETNYGKNMGSFRVADALATLGFDYPRRAEFFQKELVELLRLAKEEGSDVFAFKGSYAGAMGMPQFMPSSYRKWAVDYDRDGHRNIWGSVPDVAASVANYLKSHGWKTGGKMVIPVLLTPTPKLEAVIEEKTELKYTVGQLRRMGVEIQEPVADHERAVLFKLEVSPGLYEYYIGLNNFYAVWQYNHSRMYVTAVRDIANGVGSGGL